MIAILGKKDLDISTEQVIDWLISLEAKFLRINGTEMIDSFSLSMAQKDGFEKILNQDINMVWFRRWQDEDFLPRLLDLANSSNENVMKLHNHLRNEISVINRFFFKNLKDKKWLSTQKELSYSKLDMLQAATDCEIRVPQTLITTQKSKLISFFEKLENGVISKCLSDSPFFYTEGESFGLKTVEITRQFLQTIPNNFFLSFFQELIPKQYELRVFYLDGIFYPMAIFSQLDETTSLDFRNYNSIKPNRTVPYKLPEVLERKLHNLMESVEMTTGSLDLIRAKNGDYVFLEINPVGQFGMTSIPCNYSLEKKIAEYLFKHDN